MSFPRENFRKDYVPFVASSRRVPDVVLTAGAMPGAMPT